MSEHIAAASWDARTAAAGIVLLALSHGLAACSSGSSSGALAPSPVRQETPAPQPQPVHTAVFTDSATAFTASDVHDVQEQTVRFNSVNELIWVANDARFQEFIVNGNFIAYHHKTDTLFQVRFGTKDGKRRAYLTLPDDHLHGLVPTILDLWVDERGDLKIVQTSVPLPGT